MLLHHKIIDEYYAEESTYPYPPKDIQLIILRCSCKLNIETCKNIRLVRKCFYNDQVITKQFKKWKRNYEMPLKYLKKLKENFNKFNNMTYMDSLWWYWDAKINRNYYRRSSEAVYFQFDYIGRVGFNAFFCMYMHQIGLIEVNEKYGELAILIKSRKPINLDVLFFIYIDPKKNKNYGLNNILSGWLFNDDKTLETLRYIETYDSDAKKDGIVFDFNDFELKTINTYCVNEQKKLNLTGSSTKKYKGLTAYFANLDINANHFKRQFFCNEIYLTLDDKYPLTKKVYDDVYNVF